MKNNCEVIIHQDVLEEDMKDLQARCIDVSDYKLVFEKLLLKSGYRIPYEISSEQVAYQFKKGDTVVMSGCYGGPRECIEEYSRALMNRGVTVVFDEEAIL